MREAEVVAGACGDLPVPFLSCSGPWAAGSGSTQADEGRGFRRGAVASRESLRHGEGSEQQSSKQTDDSDL